MKITSKGKKLEMRHINFDEEKSLENCPLKPIPDSITDTEQPTVTISNGNGLVTVPANISASSEPEPSHADILAELRRLREEIRMLREGEREI